MIENSLNARSLEFPDIGRSFVLHPKFAKLAGPDNVILIGPRGSGKTTMLKMLTPEALSYWNVQDEREKQIKRGIDYLAIYIPMSKILKDDLDSRIRGSKLDRNDLSKVIKHIYWWNIVESVIEMLYYLIKQRNFDENKEYYLVKAISKRILAEHSAVYSVDSLLTEIADLAFSSRCRLDSESISDLVDVDIISRLDPLFRVINEHFKFPPSQKYALCFDELDIYTSDFSTAMIRSLRGGSVNVILKLTLAPIQEIEISSLKEYSPRQTHDYEDIYLWPYSDVNTQESSTEEIEYLQFSESLARQTLQGILGRQDEIDLNKLLGNFSYKNAFKYIQTSEIENNIFKGLELEKMKESDLTRVLFERLADIDPSFGLLLEKRGVSFKSITTIKRKLSSEVIRKMKEVVFNRLIVSKYDTEKGKWVLRTTRVPIQYHGKEIVLKSIDGNPRYLKKLMEFISSEVEFSNGQALQVPIEKQARALNRIQSIFFERLKSIPVGDDKHEKNVGKLISDIGEYFSGEMNLVHWKSPSFYSCLSIPNIREIQHYELVFRKALNNGALLLIGETNLTKLNTVKNKKMRLSYILHIHFKLPVRKYESISFEQIIKPDGGYSLFDNWL